MTARMPADRWEEMSEKDWNDLTRYLFDKARTELMATGEFPETLAILWNKDNKARIEFLPLWKLHMAGNAGRARLLDAIARMLNEIEANAYAFISETWGLTIDPGKLDDELAKIEWGRMGHDRRREEYLMVLLVNKDRRHWHIMEKIRREGHPVAGPIVGTEPLPDLKKDTFDGRLLKLFGEQPS